MKGRNISLFFFMKGFSSLNFLIIPSGKTAKKKWLMRLKKSKICGDIFFKKKIEKCKEMCYYRIID